MIISHEHQFVMFLPWKTASQTAALRLRNYNQSPYSLFFHFNSNLNRVVHQHITCADFAALPESQYNYFSGSFVRNPYDRVYSGFRQLQKDINKQPNAEFPCAWVKELVLSQLAENKAQLHAADYNFDKWVNLIREDQIFDIGRNSNFPLHPSHYWTHLHGKPYVNFVGKVETFEVDFKTFCDKIDITPKQSQNANVVELLGESLTDPSGYRYVARMNNKSISKINSLFHDDFRLFGYPSLGA